MSTYSRRRKFHVVEPYKRKDGTKVRRHIKPMPCKPSKKKGSN